MSFAKGLFTRSALLATALMVIAIGAHAQAGSLQKTAVPIDGNANGSFEVDEVVDYTLVFTNTGTTDLTNVVIRDPSSACITFDAGSVVIQPASAGTSSSSGNEVQVDLTSPMVPTASVTITFVGTATAEGSCCNQANWSSSDAPGGVSDRDPGDGVPDQPTCHVASAAPGPDHDAIVDKQILSAGCLAPGSVVDFRLRVHNTGRRPLRNVTLEDVLDSRLGNIIVDGGLTYDAASHRVFVGERTYGVGEETLYTFSATLPCTESGSLANTAEVVFEDNDGNSFRRTDTELVSWGRPNLATSTKRWRDDPADLDSVVSPGENVTFTITITNTGRCEALNLTVSDALDARFVETAPTLVISDGGTYDSGTGKIDWNAATTPGLEAIPSGSSVTLTFTTQVDPSTAGGALIPNTVTLTVLGNDSGCPGVPTLTRTVTLANGSVVYGPLAVTDTLLRNDFVSCTQDAFRTVRGGWPDGFLVPVLRERAAPQQCSAPPAINPSHPQTDAIVNPVAPYRFTGDTSPVADRCPQAPAGTGRVLIFYELQDSCTDTLRVTKDPIRDDVLITW